MAWRAFARELIDCCDSHPGPDVLGYLDIIEEHLQEQENGDFFRIPHYFFSVLCEAAVTAASPAAAVGALNRIKELNAPIEPTIVTQIFEMLRQYPESFAQVDMFYFWDNLSASTVSSLLVTLLVRDSSRIDMYLFIIF